MDSRKLPCPILPGVSLHDRLLELEILFAVAGRASEPGVKDLDGTYGWRAVRLPLM